MYGNNFFNPYMYQPYQQASNLARGLGSMSGINNLSKASSLGNTTTNLAGIKGLLGKFSFSGFLNGASKTLNVINQAIPVFYQVRPMFNNAKTMFRIMGAVKDDKPSNSRNTRNQIQNQSISNNSNDNTQIIASNQSYQNYNEENPTFFI